MFREISGWHCLSIHSDRPSSARRLKISKENQELEIVEGNELAQRGCACCGNKSRSGDHKCPGESFISRNQESEHPSSDSSHSYLYSNEYACGVFSFSLCPHLPPVHFYIFIVLDHLSTLSKWPEPIIGTRCSPL